MKQRTILQVRHLLKEIKQIAENISQIHQKSIQTYRQTFGLSVQIYQLHQIDEPLHLTLAMLTRWRYSEYLLLENLFIDQNYAWMNLDAELVHSL